MNDKTMVDTIQIGSYRVEAGTQTWLFLANYVEGIRSLDSILKQLKSDLERITYAPVRKEYENALNVFQYIKGEK